MVYGFILNNSYNLLGSNFVEIGDLVVLLLWDFVSWNNIWNGNQSVLLCFKLFFKISWRISLLFGFWLSHSIHLASSWLFMWCLCPCFCFRQNVAKTFMCFPSQATMYLIPDIYFTSCTNSNTLSFLKKKNTKMYFNIFSFNFSGVFHLRPKRARCQTSESDRFNKQKCKA